MIRATTLTNLQQDERAILFPSLGQLVSQGSAWRILVSGMVQRQGKLTLGKKLMLGILRRAMRASHEEFRSDTFNNRVRGFLCDAAKGRRLAVRIGDDIYPLSRRSRRSGLFHDELIVPVERLDAASHDRGILPMSLVGASGDDVGITTHVQLVSRQGVSVISDIDDTLKETLVHERRAMLLNTFLREFTPIAGMGDVLRQWQQQGAVFHYVSSSPWQLYEALAEHFVTETLPPGSFHLRAFRLRDHMLRRIFMGRRPAKGAVIRNLLNRYPQRKIVLVGDSGEYDPEIYGAIARRFPDQVAAILIRRVPGHTKGPPFRLQKAFRKLPTALWRMFDEAAEIAAALPEV